MLLNTLFSISAENHGPGLINATIRIHGDHAVFLGHFPGHPVLPGVTMVQIVRELMEAEMESKLRVIEIENLKFLSLINPEQNSEIEVSVSYAKKSDNLVVNATLFYGDKIFFKMVRAVLQNT